MSEQCPNSWRGRHRFEARYDRIPPTLDAFSGTRLNTTVHGMEMTLEKLTKITYVRDVCVRCGRTIEREGR